jgi:hypothetical protein
MSDFVMFMIVGAALGVVALLSVITWILILHKSHTEWRLAADNCRFASPLWNETLDDRAALNGQAILSRRQSERPSSLDVR